MENFKIESRCLKVCYEFKAFIGCMKAGFCRPDHPKFLMFKTCGRGFEMLSQAFQTQI